MDLGSSLQPKQRYSFAEAYDVTVKAARSVGSFARTRGRLGLPFVERLMLAVTEVNGCPICAYGHARVALRAGIAEDEIRQLLGGGFEDAPARELLALTFAQHYADTKGRPDQDTWVRIQDEYGLDEALGILGAIRMIMWGNVVGIAYSGFRSRLVGDSLLGSSIPRDLAMLLFGLLTLPVALLHGAVLNAIRRPILEGTPRHG